MSTPIITFYSHPSDPPPNADFSLEDYLSWSDRTLEQRHDYVQTVFPLPETSGFNWHAPQVTEADYLAFRSDAALKTALREAFDHMCAFYGFVPDRDAEGRLRGLGQAESLGRTSGHFWLVRFGHNHLRITRIIRSLRVLGLGDEAKIFYESLLAVDQRHNGIVSGQSTRFWKRAVEAPLASPPDDRNGECEWLKAIED